MSGFLEADGSATWKSLSQALDRNERMQHVGSHKVATSQHMPRSNSTVGNRDVKQQSDVV